MRPLRIENNLKNFTRDCRQLTTHARTKKTNMKNKAMILKARDFKNAKTAAENSHRALTVTITRIILFTMSILFSGIVQKLL